MDLKQIMELDELLLESARRKYRASTSSLCTLIELLRGGKVENVNLDNLSKMASDAEKDEMSLLFTEGWDAFRSVVHDLVDICKKQNILDSQQQILLALALYRRKTSGDRQK